MKGLRKVLTPFAPDQSGAESVLYGYGGIIVILDAGGCTGNICGFDEPRWSGRHSALFSAGLRDMDAIMGRDKLLIEKLAAITERIPASFAALIGTPVPAVIGTDFEALARMAGKATGLPVISLDTTGFRLCDEGAADAFLALFKAFTSEAAPQAGRVGVIGADPLDLAHVADADVFRCELAKEGYEHIAVYAIDDDLDDVCSAAQAEKNIVVAPSGLPAARWLLHTFGTPFEVRYPGGAHWLGNASVEGLSVLVVHQQVLADTLREELTARGVRAVVCASWFGMDDTLKSPSDRHLTEEEDFITLVAEGHFDCIVADDMLHRLCPDYAGLWLHVPEFSVSGQNPDVMWEQAQ